MSLNWDLCATSCGEIRVPFRNHVRPGEETTHSSLKCFKHFPRLPLELQHHILSFCDNATLFQLMHTSPVTRKEATKLFWSDPTVKYRVQGSWLLSGGYTASTHAALEAHKYMQYILVELWDSETILHDDWVDLRPHQIKFPDEEQARIYAEHQIAAFWRTLRAWFPCVVNVVLSTRHVPKSGTGPPEALTQLAEGCPGGIHVRASVFHSDLTYYKRLRSRKLWQAIKSTDGPVAWEMIEPLDTSQVVYPPIQKRSGPVGKWYRWLHDEVEPYEDMIEARKLLIIQATEAYYLHTLKAPCICPVAGCGLQFEKPGHWTLHYISSGEHRHRSGVLPPPPCETLQKAFAEHDARLERMRETNKERLAEMRAEWGEDGSEQRTHITQQFLQQLRNDPLCAIREDPEKSHFWRRYQHIMNAKDVWHMSRR